MRLTTAIKFLFINASFFHSKQVDGFSLTSYHAKTNHFHILQQRCDSNIALRAGPSDDGMILSSDMANSILTNAFASLNEEDKYDTVLTGLCAKILDGQIDTEEDEDVDPLDGPMDLLTEMNSRRVKASPRSLSAMIDVAAKSESAVSMSNILSLCIRNGGIKNYGATQNTIKTLPRWTNEDLAPIPTDDRGTEISSAVAVTIVTMVCLVLKNSVGSGPLLSDYSYYTDSQIITVTLANIIFYGLGTVGLVDNGYDALQALGKGISFASQGKFKLPELPPKEEMPFGIGQGELSGTVVAGFSRLLSVDTERECRCEAASFFTAYTLGLPCFSFRPNSLEAVVLIFESLRSKEEGTKSTLDPLLSSAGILKILIWLLAPVAIENMKYPQLIGSDPREAQGLLKRLEKSCNERNIDIYSILPFATENQDFLLRWAYRESERLLVRNKQILQALEERLAGGAATVGDCVAVLEEWD